MYVSQFEGSLLHFNEFCLKLVLWFLQFLVCGLVVSTLCSFYWFLVFVVLQCSTLFV